MSSVNIAVPEIKNQIIDFRITPNPLTTLTTLSFQLSSPNNTSIEIRNIEGRLIKKLAPNNFNIGLNEIVWNATNNAGSKVDAGIYFITILSDNFSETKKVVVLRN